MAQASYAVPQFLGGEISAFAQGRFDKPDYRVSMRACLNSFPVEIGAWTRRPGTAHAGTTRAGQAGRTVKFDFQQSNPFTLEFTDGFLRFRNGTTPIFVDDSQTVVSISAATPAVLQVASPAPAWTPSFYLRFTSLGATAPLLQNREIAAITIDSTHFSLFDPLTSAPIDGSTLGALAVGATAHRIHELSTPYIGQSWSGLRAVQAEKTDILLTSTIAPQALTVVTSPSAVASPVFAIAPAIFNDGPYLDPFINGVQATPSGKSGLISLTLSFPAYDSTKAYAAGSFVTSASINYVSLQDQNVNNTPASSPTFWALTGASAAINNGLGFLGTDIGRLVRLLSEPPVWVAGTSYTPASVVSFNPSGQPGAALYYQSLVTSSSTVAPGTDLTTWKIIPQGAAIWTWGKITALLNVIDRALAGSVPFGDTSNLGSAFDGTFSKAFPSSAGFHDSAGNTVGPVTITRMHYVGKNYSAASAQKIQQATVYPTSDRGFATATYVVHGSTIPFGQAITLNLRAKNTVPANSSDGVLLGSSGAIANTFAAVTVVSNDQTTAYNYVWVEMIVTSEIGPVFVSQWDIQGGFAQISFFNPPGTGTGGGATVEILGPPLLYTNSINTWRLGVYSGTTGWPTCGVYNDGRLYLGGAVGNRFDACVSNGIVGGTINFAPTDQYGVVAASSAISYTFNSNGVNQILWMDPDLQGVKMGTQAGEWLVVAPTAGPIAPNNISARNVTTHGSANVQPCRTEHTTIFVQRFAQKLLEYFPDVFSGKFSAPNLADKAAHLTRAGVAELAYTSAVTPVVWGRDTAGALFGITYKRDSLASAQPPTFYGWHRHALGSGRTVESICAGPSVGGDLDSLTMVTNDAGTSIRHVEVLTDAQDETAPLASAWFLDNAIAPSSIDTSNPLGVTLNGLWHLNGKTVQIFAGGLDLGDPGEGKPFSDFVVSNGSVFVTYGDGISAGAGRGLFTAAFVATNPQIVVGFTYNSDGQLVRMIAQADTGARNGPAFAVLSRGHRFGMKLVNALGLSVGADFSKKMYPQLYKTDGNKDIAPLTTFTGIYQDSLQDNYGYDNALCWRVSRPFPATIVAVGSNLSTQDQ